MTADAPPPLLCVDFESRSLASIKALGSRLYAQHPTTQVICGCFAWRDNGRYETFRWVPANAQEAKGPVYGYGSGPGAEWRSWSAFPFGDMADTPFEALAHNHYFDARVWERLGWPKPVRWIDTSELARRAGMPAASLEFLSAELLGDAKDLEGNKIMRSLSRPWKARKQTAAQIRRGEPPEPRREFALDPIPSDLRERTVAYCEKDALLACRLYYEHLAPWDHVSDLEDAILYADRLINERGVPFDAELARAVLKIDERLAADALAAAGITNPTDVNSDQKFTKAMAALGVVLENAQKATLEPLLEHEDEQVASLVAARLGGRTIAGSKLRSGLLKLSDDGTIKDMLRYCGAHTWRWSGVNPQPQNLPKPARSATNEEVEAVVARAFAEAAAL